MTPTTRRIALQSSVLLLIFIINTTDLNPRAILASAQRTSARPFEMLVLGDSVVWGQGLNEDQKFYSKVKEAIKLELGGREVHQLVKAHSGASISPKKAVACPIAPGEVPILTPTLLAQVDSALSTYAAFGVKPEDVDLVLLNGGINDVTFPIIVNPFTSEKTITKQSEKFCKQGMRTLLNRLTVSFPRAVIVVTGYFPMISRATDPDLLMKLIQAFFGENKSKDIIHKAEKEQRKEVKAAARLHQVLPNEPDWLIRRLALLSSHWKSTSDADLQAAVDEVTTGMPVKRVLFAQVDFQPEECYAAPQTNFWKITGSGGGVGNLITDDSMFSVRQETCRLAAPDLNSFQKLICPAAGTGHPNERGAQKYFAAIFHKLQESRISWRSD